MSIYGLVKNFEQSNQAGELYAVLEALKIAKRDKLERISIITDSRYVIGSMTKCLSTWLENNSKDTRERPIVIKELLEATAAATEGIEVTYYHVATLHPKEV